MAVSKTAEATTTWTKGRRKPRSILERLTKPTATVKRFLVVIYGREGVGKTTLIGTMRGKGLVIDVPQYEGGTEVLSDKQDRITIAPVVKWEELDQLYQSLRSGELKGRFDWVAIDTLTACQSLARKKVLRERDVIESRPYQIRMQDWGAIGNLMDQLIAQFRLLSIPVIMMVHERSRDPEEDDMESVRSVEPMVSPATIRALVPHPKLIGHLFIKATEGGMQRRLRVGKHPAYYSKNRSIPGRPLPDVIRTPHLGNILDYMMGKDVKPPRKARDDDAIVLDLASE